MWNTQFSESRLLDDIAERIRKSLPSSWVVEMSAQVRMPGRKGRRRLVGLVADTWQADATLQFRAPSGQLAKVWVEIKKGLEARDALALMAEWRQRTNSPILVAAPFLSPRTREVLREWGASYADSTGNLRISLQEPVVLVERPGADRGPSAEKRPLRSLRGRAAGRAVRALVDYPPPFGVRELAKRSRNSVATVYRTVDLLEREALLQRQPSGKVDSVNRTGTLRRWAQDYSFTKSNRTVTCIDPRGAQNLQAKLSSVPFQYALTGSIAASELVPVVATRLGTLYVESTQKAMDVLDLRAAEAGANVILAEPFDPVVFERTWSRGRLRYAAVSQVAVDLLTGPGRSPAEGEALLSWLERNGYAGEP